jgi:hypothetical protein
MWDVWACWPSPRPRRHHLFDGLWRSEFVIVVRAVLERADVEGTVIDSDSQKILVCSLSET